MLENILLGTVHLRCIAKNSKINKKQYCGC